MYTVLNEKSENDFNIIKINDGEFAGCKFALGEIKFGDEPNDDGTYNVSFDYNITNDYNISEERLPEFKVVMGDILTSLVEQAVARSEEIVYKGGQ